MTHARIEHSQRKLELGRDVSRLPLRIRLFTRMQEMISRVRNDDPANAECVASASRALETIARASDLNGLVSSAKFTLLRKR